MAGFTESGITLDFPTDNWFRFEKTEPHKSISCFNFKEMDACWIDYADGKFYAIELKDYTATGSLEPANTADRKWNITKKDSSKGYIGAFKDNCLEALRGYTKVCDKAHVIVMTYEQARRKLPFVV